MSNPNTIPVVTLGKSGIFMHEVLRRLHHRGRLVPLLREAAVEKLIDQQARAAGLTVTAEELQQTTNDFRRRHGLTTAKQTHAWLEQQRLTVADLEAALERDLLMDKLKDHVTRDGIADHFAAHSAEYARARLRQIVVHRADLAQELFTQIHEGADFADMAQQHSHHPSRDVGGALGWVLRRQLPPLVADAVFAAQKGAILGPLATPEGFHLVLVEDLAPAQLNDATAALVRQDLFNRWLQDKLRGVPMTFPLLDAL